MGGDVDRRTLLRVGAAGLAASVSGCGGVSGRPDFLPVVGGGKESSEVPDRIDEYLRADPAAPNYDGTLYMADAVQSDFVNIYVGRQDEGVDHVFVPPAVMIPPQSTVRWNWVTGTGEHAVRSVEASDIAIDSGAPVTDRDDYGVTFAEEGICLYECSVHGDAGMKGGIVVTGDPY